MAFVLIKSLVFDVVRVNSRDMEPTLNYGEAFLISKQFPALEQGDLIYFEYPVADSSMISTFMIQRLVALPGEVLEIRRGEVYVNNQRFEIGSSLKQNYFVSAVHELDSAFRDEFKISDGGAISTNFDYSFAVNDSMAKQLAKLPYIKRMERRMEASGLYDENCFPYHPSYPWNADHYGKLKIPKVNDTLRLDTGSIALYSQLIRDYEKNHLAISNDSIFVNGALTKEYIVKKNYYFVLGDNRGNANDSRNWGYLPESSVIGVLQNRLRRAP
jgi:signal peptidase I